MNASSSLRLLPDLRVQFQELSPQLCHKYPTSTMSKARRRQSENASRRKNTLIKKVYEYGELFSADVALIIYKNGRYSTYRSVNKPSFPPSMKEIVGSLKTLMELY
jgi:hypothetical protein